MLVANCAELVKLMENKSCSDSEFGENNITIKEKGFNAALVL